VDGELRPWEGEEREERVIPDKIEAVGVGLE